MADRIPTLVPRDAIERRVTKLWRASGLVDGSIATYLVWVRLFRNRFPTASPAAYEHLTCAAVTAFSKSYAGHRRGCYNVKASTRRVARTALRAWWCALHLLREPVPAWGRPVSPLQRSPLLTAYEEYRRAHRGVATATLLRDMDVASSFVKSLRVRGRGLAGARVVDIDRFVDKMSPRLCRRFVPTAFRWTTTSRTRIPWSRSRDKAEVAAALTVRAATRDAEVGSRARQVFRAVPLLFEA